VDLRTFVLGDVQDFCVTSRVLHMLSIGIPDGGETDVLVPMSMTGMDHIRSAVLLADLGGDMMSMFVELLFRHAVLGIWVDWHESVDFCTPNGRP